MTEHENGKYDLFVIGSGPAGQRAAIQGAKLGKRVGLAERALVIGGVCVRTGTIPSKSLREAVVDLTGYEQRGFYGSSYAVKQNITITDLLSRADMVVESEVDIMRNQLMRNRVDVFTADASFVDPHTLRLVYADGFGERLISADYIVVAAGSQTAKDAAIPFDGVNILSSDDVLHMDRIPSTLTVVGAGVIGCEYASIFATLGARVTLIDKRHDLLPFLDAEITDTLAYQLRQNRVTLRLGEAVSGIESVDEDRGHRARILLESGKQILTEKALYSIGRIGATASLDLGAAGVEADERGRIKANEHFQTSVPHIYAVGDVIGFPSLASTSMEQGRMAAAHAFGLPVGSMPELFPYGVYTIPEISMVGRTEEDLTDAGVPYDVGKANYREIARGQIVGDVSGMLKLIFHLETKQLLGVHIIGHGASELIHIGQAVMAFGGTVDYFLDAVFNYPTLAECYKTAAFDAINRMS
jgi:NAD(P) transhydrogenase